MSNINGRTQVDSENTDTQTSTAIIIQSITNLGYIDFS